MISDLHKELQHKAEAYLRNKGYWICGQEVPMPPGVCDAWGMRRSSGYSDGNYHAMAIEVKVSRTDFRSRSQKFKEISSFPLGNVQYVLCPANMIQPHEVHKEWGLLWWSGTKIVNKKRAPEIEMTAAQKLQVLIHFLENGVNEHRPLLPSQELLLADPHLH